MVVAHLLASWGRQKVPSLCTVYEQIFKLPLDLPNRAVDVALFLKAAVSGSYCRARTDSRDNPTVDVWHIFRVFILKQS